jgi:hypothetical protein
MLGNERDRLFSLERILAIFSSIVLGDLADYSQYPATIKITHSQSKDH